MNEMEQTRSAMTEKLEALENEVVEKVRPVATAVERVADAAAGIVESVKDTVNEVKEKVEATASAVTSAFDLRKQTEAHPWVVFGMAATTGCLVGSFLARRSSRGHRKAQAGSAPKQGRETNGKSHHTKATPAKTARESATSGQNSWFVESLQHLKGLAVGALMSAVRDLAKQGIPGNLGEKIAEEVECMTRKMGAEPIQGPVLPQDSEPKQESSEDAEFKTMPEPVNRILSNG